MAGAALALAAPAGAKSKLQTIYQSTTTGDYLIGTFANPDGSVFVVTTVGPNNSGQILLLTPVGNHYQPTVIKAFACDVDGGNPGPSLVPDAAGNVWGMGNGCGGNPNADPQGTLFELVKPQAGGSWTFKTVVQMPTGIGNLGVVGSGYGRRAFDKAGNMYGLVTLGCNAQDGCGKIFRIPAALLDGSKPKDKVKILYTFPTNTTQPSGLVRDKAGNLFGVEYAGGTPQLGSVWEVRPPTTKNGAWTGGNIYEFCKTQDQGTCDDGTGPAGLPALDGKGDIFGTANAAGAGLGNGTAWTLVPSGGSWTFGLVHVFNQGGNQCPPGSDYNVVHPGYNTVLDKKGQLLTFMQNAGDFDPCGPNQSAIYGGLMSVSPVTGGDTVVNNQFAVQQHVSGPYVAFSSPSLMGDVVFGTSQAYYDAGTDTYSAGVVFKITP